MCDNIEIVYTYIVISPYYIQLFQGTKALI